nr:uncharacterized protein LOC127303739 [Lolium perenne]
MVLASNQTARQLWLAILELFSANKARDMSITAYCRRQKQLSDALADNDSPVNNRALVLNTLRGLGPRFSSAATIISMTEPLPTFLRVRNMLLMEEMQQANAAANAASTALVAQARPPPPPTCTGTACRGDSTTGKPKPVYKPKTKTGGRNGGGPSRAAAPAPTGPWVCFSPGGSQWRAPSGPGILGPCPHAAYTTTSAPV